MSDDTGGDGCPGEVDAAWLHVEAWHQLDVVLEVYQEITTPGAHLVVTQWYPPELPSPVGPPTNTIDEDST